MFIKGKFPKITKHPVVSVNVKNNSLRFECKIDPEENENDVRYEVTWFQGTPRKEIKKENLSTFKMKKRRDYLTWDKRLDFIEVETLE